MTHHPGCYNTVKRRIPGFIGWHIKHKLYPCWTPECPGSVVSVVLNKHCHAGEHKRAQQQPGIIQYTLPHELKGAAAAALAAAMETDRAARRAASQPPAAAVDSGVAVQPATPLRPAAAPAASAGAAGAGAAVQVRPPGTSQAAMSPARVLHRASPAAPAPPAPSAALAAGSTFPAVTALQHGASPLRATPAGVAHSPARAQATSKPMAARCLADLFNFTPASKAARPAQASVPGRAAASGGGRGVTAVTAAAATTAAASLPPPAVARLAAPNASHTTVPITDSPQPQPDPAQEAAALNRVRTLAAVWEMLGFDGGHTWHKARRSTGKRAAAWQHRPNGVNQQEAAPLPASEYPRLGASASEVQAERPAPPPEQRQQLNEGEWPALPERVYYPMAAAAPTSGRAAGHTGLSGSALPPPSASMRRRMHRQSAAHTIARLAMTEAARWRSEGAVVQASTQQEEDAAAAAAAAASEAVMCQIAANRWAGCACAGRVRRAAPAIGPYGRWTGFGGSKTFASNLMPCRLNQFFLFLPQSE